ncbi:MAG: rhodanese-like domain-containing protein [Deltaproteobacteria bacterium]|nr:rhodanese-like domain-containing protein [Deltaproteobacteria bacterium]
MIRKKYILKVALVSLSLLVAFFLTGFYEGSVGSDGAVLKQYLPPEKLKELVDKPDSSMWIIDVRPASAYQKGHIPTATSFPSSTILTRLGELPKDQYLILYCETGVRAHRVMKQLEKQGYTRLMVWGGVSRWPYELVKGAQ